MISYKALSRASITLQLIEKNDTYSCEIFSSEGNILQPYDLNTTLTGVVFKEFEDITKDIKEENIKWTIWNEHPDEDFKQKWNKEHIGKNPITLSCDEINGKAIIQFEVYKDNNLGSKDLIACNRITILDINDLITTTNKPINPYDGQLWVDTSTTPATLWVWQNDKWNMVGTISATVKNLIRNSNFINYNYDPFEIVGNTRNQYIPIIKPVNGRRWLNIKSDVISDEDKGISQTTLDSEIINSNSDYSFQFLAYASDDSSSYNNSIEVKIISIDSNNLETVLYHGGVNKEITLNKNICRFFTSFKTLLDTKKIKVEILGKHNSIYDFNVTQLALYNTSNDYPWQSNPEDNSMMLDSQTIFNALTRNGEIQGIYSAIDPNTGQLQYYFNASYIKSGTITGDLINAKNLVVTKNDGTKTLYIDNEGNVSLIVTSLVIGSSNQNIDDYIDSKIGSDSKLASIKEMMDSTLFQIEKDYLVTEHVYNEIYNNTDFQQLEFKGTASDWLDELPEEEIITSKDLLYYLFEAYKESYNDLKSSINDCKIDYENNKNSFNANYSKYNNRLAKINKYFVNCQSYISDAKIEATNESWSQFEVRFNSINTEVGNLKENYTIHDGKISSIETDLNTVKQEITPESITSKVQKIVSTDGQINEYITSVAEQSAQGFNQEVVDELNGNFSDLKQTVNGFEERISGVEDKNNYRLEMSVPDGTVLRSATSSTVIYAKIYNWNNDITSTIDESKINWYRRSRNKENDDYWHNEYGKGKKSITITTDDIQNYATFYFTVDV